jgi:hypothetical protein
MQNFIFRISSSRKFPGDLQNKTCEQIYKYLLPRRRLSIIHITLFTKQAALEKGEKNKALKLKFSVLM